jgi:Bacterial membrane protein YfhO
MAPNLAMLYGLYGVAGYDGMTPRHLDEVVRPTQSQLNFLGSGYLPEVPIFRSPVRDLLGVRHILVPPDVALDGPGLSLQYVAADGRIYRSETALPRAFVVSHARCLGDEQTLRLIRERAIDFRREVLLAGCATARLAGNGPSTATAEIDHYAPHRVVITTASDHPGYLVLTDTWFPGWTAHVDGRESPVERADHAFRAVKLEPGRHTVEFRYDPGSVRLGLALSVLALLAIVALAWSPRRRRSHADEP